MTGRGESPAPGGIRARKWRRVFFAFCVLAAFGAAVWQPLSEEVVDATVSAAGLVTRSVERSHMVAGLIAGRVLSQHGVLISHPRVCALDINIEPIGGPAIVCTDTRSAGAYRFSALPTGAYRFRAAARGYFPGVANYGAPLPLTAAAILDRVDIVFAPGGPQVTGNVVDASGGPVPHAVVRAGNIRSSATVDFECDDEGRFELWMDTGTLARTASAPGYASTIRPVTAPANDIVLRLVPAGTIEGRVLERDTS